MKKKNISKNLKKTGWKNIVKNIQTEDGVAYLEEDVSGGIQKANKEVEKKKKEKKKEKKEARQRSCRAVVRLQFKKGFLGVVKVTYCL